MTAPHSPLRRLTPWVHRLRDDAGMSLIDSIVGVIVIAIAMSAIVSISMTVAHTMAANSTTAGSQAHLRTVVNELALDPLSVPDTVVTATDGGYTTSSVRVNKGSWALIRVTTSIGSADCTDALNPNYSDCFVEEKLVDTAPAAHPVYTPIVMALSAAGAGADTAAGASVDGSISPVSIGSATVPGSAHFVLRVSGAAAAGTITFTQAGSILTEVAVDADTQGYFYGDIPSSGGQPVEMTYSGKIITVANLLIYEVS